MITFGCVQNEIYPPNGERGNMTIKPWNLGYTIFRQTRPYQFSGPNGPQIGQ